MRKLLVFIILISGILSSDEPSQCKLRENFSETMHSAAIQGKPLDYKATAGNLVLKDCNGKDQASIFFVAYTKDTKDERPITFCFNGGPGSSAVWLHIGAFGPKILNLEENPALVAPYTLIDNANSILDLTDLVFIDPVSTGHSVAAPGVDPRSFHNVKEDAKSVEQFIRQYLSRYNRWNSPKYIAGESYGTLRAGALSHMLLENGVYLNGVILISSILDYHNKEFVTGNDLPYMLYLPSYTAAAWHHKKLQNQDLTLEKALTEAEEFALNEYALALHKGNLIGKEEYNKVKTRLAELTGLSEHYIDLANLRIFPYSFSKELLRDEKKITGRFDSRNIGCEEDCCASTSMTDPGMSIKGPFTGAFTSYLANELKWNCDQQYCILANLFPWGWGESNKLANTAEDLTKAFNKNPNLKVYVASGYYDIATPYFATEFTFNHMELNQDLRSRLFMHKYEGGHMPYLSPSNLSKMRKDLEQFYKAK